MKKTITLVLVVLAVIVGLGLGQQKGEKDSKRQTPQPSPESQKPDESALLNAKPQKVYPEFTLDAQKVAMQKVAEMRKKSRVQGLRDKIPPADWIDMAYHGLVIDANLDPITMDLATVSKMQESMFSILYGAAGQKAVNQFKFDLKELFYNQKTQAKEQAVVRDTVISALLAAADQKLQDRYLWRHRLIHGSLASQVDPSLYTLSPEVQEMMRGIRPWPSPTSEYVEECRGEGVPIPPDWPDPGWIRQGDLAFVFISDPAVVFAYKDPAVPGACIALPRRSAGSITFLGIICQSATTGKACFWDNVSADGRRITGPEISMDIQTVQNGSNLLETCTECHRGDNVFNIHPGTALQLSQPTAIGGPYVTEPAVRYTPMGQPHWSNPGPLVMPTPAAGQSSCVSCHNFPETAGAFYCSAVLQNAAMQTMPPFGPRRAGWPGSPSGVNPLYADHIARLAGCP